MSVIVHAIIIVDGVLSSEQMFLQSQGMIIQRSLAMHTYQRQRYCMISIMET
jgi:hypothetical protein